MGRFLSGTRGPAGLWRGPRLRKLFQSGASLRLQFPKEDLGFGYVGPWAAVISQSSMQQLLRGQRWQVSSVHFCGAGRVLSPRPASCCQGPCKQSADAEGMSSVRLV